MTAAVSRYVRVVLAELELELGRCACHLLEVLGNCAGTDGVSWWSVDSLAARMRVSPATVRRARAELVAAGVVQVDVGGGSRSNVYRLPVATLEVVHTPRASARGQAVDPARQCAVPRAPASATPRVGARGSIQEVAKEDATSDELDTTPAWWAERFGHLTGTSDG